MLGCDWMDNVDTDTGVVIGGTESADWKRNSAMFQLENWMGGRNINVNSEILFENGSNWRILL